VDTALTYDHEALQSLCRKHHVRRLHLFDSRAKGSADTDSDVDLLVEYEPGRTPGLLGFIELERGLEDIFGREVDLVSNGGLSPYLRDEVLQTRSPLYEG
jgi:predicted nucleotidyltransferase